MNSRKKAVVLLSGGVDSTTVMAIAKQEGFEIYSLSFFYEQRHSFEIEAAKKVANAMDVKKHLIIEYTLMPIKQDRFSRFAIDEKAIDSSRWAPLVSES